MPRGFTDKEKEEIREKIIRKGRKIFGRYGYDKTSIDKIVEAVGIAKGSFYKFYPNKELLYLHCLADLEREMDEKRITPLIEGAETAEALLEGLIDLALNGFSAYPLLRTWFETPSRERILSFLDGEQRRAMDGTDLARAARVNKRLSELGGEFRGTDEDLASLFRALFFLNDQSRLITGDFAGFTETMKAVLTRGALK